MAFVPVCAGNGLAYGNCILAGRCEANACEGLGQPVRREPAAVFPGHVRYRSQRVYCSNRILKTAGKSAVQPGKLCIAADRRFDRCRLYLGTAEAWGNLLWRHFCTGCKGR